MVEISNVAQRFPVLYDFSCCLVTKFTDEYEPLKMIICRVPFGFIIIIIFIPSVSMIPRNFGKKLSEIQNVGVTITPGSPRG